MAEIYKSHGKMSCFDCQGTIEKGTEYVYRQLSEGRNTGSVAVCLTCGGVRGSR